MVNRSTTDLLKMAFPPFTTHVLNDGTDSDQRFYFDHFRFHLLRIQCWTWSFLNLLPDTDLWRKEVSDFLTRLLFLSVSVKAATRLFSALTKASRSFMPFAINWSCVWWDSTQTEDLMKPSGTLQCYSSHFTLITKTAERGEKNTNTIWDWIRYNNIIIRINIKHNWCTICSTYTLYSDSNRLYYTLLH